MVVGHRLKDIKKYTRRQLLLFNEYAAAEQQNRRADHLDDLCLVFNGKPYPNSEKLRRS